MIELIAPYIGMGSMLVMLIVFNLLAKEPKKPPRKDYYKYL